MKIEFGKLKMKKVNWFNIGIVIFVILIAVLVWKIVFNIIGTDFENQIEYKNFKIGIKNIPTEEMWEDEEIKNIICGVVNGEQSPVYELSDYDRWYIECIVAGESGNEPILGKMAVAQCILNAMIKNNYSPKEVRVHYNYSGWDENFESKNKEMYEEVKRAVWRVFDNGEGVTDNPILFFYAPKYVYSKWHENQEFDCEIGGHRFFYLKEDLNSDWYNNLLKTNNN